MQVKKKIKKFKKSKLKKKKHYAVNSNISLNIIISQVLVNCFLIIFDKHIITVINFDYNEIITISYFLSCSRLITLAFR